MKVSHATWMLWIGLFFPRPLSLRLPLSLLRRLPLPRLPRLCPTLLRCLSLQRRPRTRMPTSLVFPWRLQRWHCEPLVRVTPFSLPAQMLPPLFVLVLMLAALPMPHTEFITLFFPPQTSAQPSSTGLPAPLPMLAHVTTIRSSARAAPMDAQVTVSPIVLTSATRVFPTRGVGRHLFFLGLHDMRRRLRMLVRYRHL